MAAKQLVEERRKLYIPDRIVRVYFVDEMGNEHSPQKTLIPAGMIDFSSVRLEQNVSDFRPDLVATTVNGNDLLIEIAVTHFVDEEKQKKIENNGTAAIEIDASKIPVLNFETLAKLLFELSPQTQWLFHPRDESTKSALHERLIPTLEAAKFSAAEKLRILAERKAKTIEREKRHNQKIESQKLKNEEQRCKERKEFKAMNNAQKFVYLTRCLKIDVGDIPSFLNYKVRFERAFRVPRNIWQLTIFEAIINKKLSHEWGAFKSDKVVS